MANNVCQYCGNQLTTNARYCTQCGKPVGSYADESTQPIPLSQGQSVFQGQQDPQRLEERNGIASPSFQPTTGGEEVMAAHKPSRHGTGTWFRRLTAIQRMLVFSLIVILSVALIGGGVVAAAVLTSHGQNSVSASQPSPGDSSTDGAIDNSKSPTSSPSTQSPTSSPTPTPTSTPSESNTPDVENTQGTTGSAEDGHYVNVRFAYSIDVPAGFTWLPEAGNSDGRQFTNDAIGMSIAVWGSYNINNDDIDSVFNFNDPKLAYSSKTNDGFVASWIEDGMIVYRHELYSPDVLRVVEFRYPESQRAAGDAIVEKFSPTLKATISYGQ